MNDLYDVRQDSFITESSSTKKTRKVKKVKRRESDGIKITEIENSGIDHVGEHDEEGYLNELKIYQNLLFFFFLCVPFCFFFLCLYLSLSLNFFSSDNKHTFV